jgi:hypothetical protein
MAGVNVSMIGKAGFSAAKYSIPALILITVMYLTFFFSEKSVVIDVPLQWNNAIEQIGFEPVYPPQEGIEVGDIFLRVSPPDVAGPKIPPDYYNDSFTGRSIKIKNMDLTSSVSDYEPRMLLSATVFDSKGDLVPDQPETAEYKSIMPTKDANIRMSQVGFPTFSISTTTNGNSFLSWFGGGADKAKSTAVSFGHVQTYAASPIAAAVSLDRYCKNYANDCLDDKNARALFAKAIDASINCSYQGSYIFNIDIMIVSQVFSTRSVSVVTTDADGLDFFIGDTPDAKNSTAKISHSSKHGLEMKSVFKRPVVFAYKRVARRIPKGTPPDGDFCRRKD